MYSHTEENYLKAVFTLNKWEPKGASTNSIAEKLNTKPSSVSDMIRRLADKGMVNHKKYQGPTLTQEGRKAAVGIIRKHRLWETFLVSKLGFKWDEVHELAEELEHIQSQKLTDRLEEYLGFPEFDPHGDPIPDKEGNIRSDRGYTLSDMEVGEAVVVVGVKESTPEYLRYLEEVGLVLGTPLTITDHFAFDGSIKATLTDGKTLTISPQAGKNLFVKPDQEKGRAN